MEFSVRHLGNLKRSAMRFGDCAADSKPKTHASGLPGDERLKETFPIRRRDTWAIVGHYNAQMLLTVALNKDAYSTVLATRADYRLNGVGNEIAQDDFHLQTIYEERRDRRRLRDIEHNAFAFDCVFTHTARSRKQLVDLHFLQPGGSGPEEIPESAHNLRSAFRFREDLADSFLDL